MKAHTKIYFDYFEHTIADFISCEICGAEAVDINHIECRGMGGSKLKDSINNLMATCRNCHEIYGDKKHHKEYLIQIHQKKINEYT